MHCRTKDGPTHHRCYSLRRNPTFDPRRWSLFEPGQKDRIEFLLNRPLKERLELRIRRWAMAMKRPKEVKDGLDEHTQSSNIPVGRWREFAGNHLLKLLADNRIQQRVLVVKVRVEGRAVDGRSLCDVLHADGGEALLLEEFNKCLL